MKSMLLFIFQILSICAMAQTTMDAKDSIPMNDKVFTKVDVEASFPGGDAGWKSFLIDNLKLTKIGKKLKFEKGQKQISETVIVKFIVSKDGSIADINIENKEANSLFKEEAIRVIKASPNWKPAQQNGRKVNAYRRQPITFVFDKE